MNETAERAAYFLNSTLGIEIVDGFELQPEEADIALAEHQAQALADALAQMRVGLRLVRTNKEDSRKA